MPRETTTTGSMDLDLTRVAEGNPPFRPIPPVMGWHLDQVPNHPGVHALFREARRTLPAVLMDRPMLSIRFSLYLVGAMAVAALPACRHSGQEEVGLQIARKNAELDRLSWQAGNAGLPPARILSPVGGHDGDPPAGASQAFRAPGMALERRIRVAKGSHRPRLDAARPHAGNSRGGPGQDLAGGLGQTAEHDQAATAPFWEEQDFPLTILPIWLISTWERCNDRPQDPADADGPARSKRFWGNSEGSD